MSIRSKVVALYSDAQSFDQSADDDINLLIDR